MVYVFKFTLDLGDQIFARSVEFDCDCFSSALKSLALELLELPSGSTVTFNSYYRANLDYRKFRERECLELMFNTLSRRIH